jgi:NAD(P)H-dependent FMN reductase
LTSKPRIAVIIGSTRDTRFADKPAAWIFDLAS